MCIAFLPEKCSYLKKGGVLLRREISLKVICEKSNFQIVIFAIVFVTMNGHAYKLFKNIFNDVLTTGACSSILHF